MVNGVLRSINYCKLRMFGNKFYKLQLMLLLIPVLFINLGIGLVTAKAENSNFIALNSSSGTVVLDTSRLNESRVIPVNKTKRISISSAKEIHSLKTDFRLRPFKDFDSFLLLTNRPLKNFRLEFLFLDLPPPPGII